MNYLEYLTTNYGEIVFNNNRTSSDTDIILYHTACYCLYTDTTNEVIYPRNTNTSGVTRTHVDMLNIASQYANEHNKTLNGVALYFNDDFYIYSTSYVDYIALGELMGDEIEFLGYKYDVNTSGNHLSQSTDYYIPAYNQSYSFDNSYVFGDGANAYLTFDMELNQNAGVYDFTSINNVGYLPNDYNYLFYDHCLKMSYTDNQNTQRLQVAFGSIIGSVRDTSYSEGVSAGYGSGHYDGYAEGYEAGSRVATDTTYKTAFDYVGMAFTAVSDILSLQVLPHVTLGLVFSIPLTLVVCMTIFKVVKK